MRHLRHALALGALVAVSIPATPALEAQNMGDAIIAATEYREIGPTRQSGRFVDIAVPADDPHTFYIATASGGLWRTNNRGISFDVLFADQADVFSIGAIAVSQTNSNVLYLGSGEGNNSRSSYWGNGMYKSTDYGDTWTNVGLPESHHFGRIVVHPTNPDVVYAAALGKLYSENDERGLYKTTNGGRSWDQVLAPDVEGRTIGVVDVVMSPADPNTLYAATYDKVRLPYTFDLAGPGSRVYKTTDGGDNWIQIGAGLPEGMLGRIGIDVYDKDPNILYATIENANKADMSDEDRREELLNHESSRGMIGGEVYRSNDAGLTWERASEEGGNVGGGPAYYYGQVIVDPNDADKAYVLSASSWGTSNGGETWERRAFGNIGGDDHALWINPNDSEHMILGYDHGMGVTYDAGENWYHPDFQSLAQFYAIGLDNSYPYRVAGGLQDNGSAMAYNTNPAGGPVRLEDWSRVGGGDGMFNEFDWCEGRFLYNESQFGPISRLDLETGESKGIRHQDADMRYNWMAPIMVSPHNCDVVFHAGNKLMRSPFRGETWEVISPDLSKNDPATLTTGKGGDGNIQYGTITTIDESILKAGLIWAGTDDGNVQVTQDGGDNWADVTDNIPNNPEYWVTRVEASHHELGTAYVSFSGLRNDDFGAYVYKTSNFGESWTDISSNLPESSVNVVIEHYENPNLLFVGTDLQVHASLDGGMNWQSMKGDMPTVPVHDIEIHTRENDLVVGTHGRGIYIADVSELSQVNSMNMTAQAHLFDPEDKVRYVASDRMNRSYSNFDGESEPSGSTLSYYLGSEATDVSVSIYRSTVMIAELEGETEAGFHEIMWDMTSRRERSEAEQEVARGQNQGGGRGGFGRGRGGPDRTRFEVNEAPAGEYRVVLTVDGQEMDSTVRILKDEWAAERR
ncbi:MAG: VPS10 domain-containing protein [Longimicrobiales bacterium]